MITRFVVLTSQRSGSTWLIDCFDKLEGVTAYGELFLPQTRIWDAGAQDHPRFFDSELWRARMRPLSVFAYLDGLYRRSSTVGFKLMYTQLRAYPEILAYLRRHRVRVVHLIRWNHLDVLISLRVAEVRGQAHVLAGGPVPEAVSVRLDSSQVVAELQRLRRNIRIARWMLSLCLLPHIEVAYEDLLNDSNSFQTICQFLRLDSRGTLPGSDLVRSQRGHHAEVLINYSEVKQVLADSVFADLIE